MNNGASEAAAAVSNSRGPQTRHGASNDELSRTKRELMQAEVRLAKARATIVTAEIDVRVISAKLKALAK
jgi:hypothetical protein